MAKVAKVRSFCPAAFHWPQRIVNILGRASVCDSLQIKSIREWHACAINEFDLLFVKLPCGRSCLLTRLGLFGIMIDIQKVMTTAEALLSIISAHKVAHKESNQFKQLADCQSVTRSD